MPLETATYISDLNASNPVGATDPLSSTDDHLRLLKSVLKNSFPGVTGAVNATQGQLNNLNSLAALSVLANATGGAAAPSALTASANGQVLARIGGALVFSADYPQLSVANAFTALNSFANATTTLISLDTSHVDGGFIRIKRNTTTMMFIGNAKAVAGGTLDDSQVYANQNLLLTAAGGTVQLNGVASTDFARLSQSNTFTGATQVIQAATARLVIDDTGSGSNAVVRFNDNGNAKGFVGIETTGSGTVITGNSDGDLCLRAEGTGIALSGDSGATMHVRMNNAGAIVTKNTSAAEFGYKGLPQNSQSVSYTTVLADANKHLHQTGATKTFTIDSNANVAYPIGTTLVFTCDNATGVSIAITTDTLRLAGTATTGTRTLAQYGIATAIKILSTTWLISGPGLS